MARMYSRKRGKSSSKKPSKKSASWVKYKPTEVNELIVKLAGDGHQSNFIGIILRDRYGIPDVKTIAKKSIVQIMKDKKVYSKLPEDLLNMLKRAVNLDEHLKKNKRDYTSKRGLELTESKIRRLAKYYKRKEVLQADWKYDLERARLLVK
ncbi:MAG: 30S ribosomal protein S15 [Candidatus Aenigmarchaeota archaeon]|nr:30S ribosomal protein S15 [Candidatus Aenigmarchaeota archaeon]